MATRGIVHSPVDKQIVSQELRAAYGLEYLKRLAADALAAFYSVPCALGTQWTVTANANGVKVAIPALRQAVVSDASGRMRLLQATAALPEGMDVFTPIPNAECYIGLRFEEVPYRASQLGAPTVSGGVAPFAYDLVQERIGLTNVPDSVDLATPDHTILDVTTLFEGPWTSATYTRTIVAWLVNPVTGGAEAIWTGTAALVGGAIVADVPHRFGQSSASGTASDYAVCLLGPIITTDPEILTDPTICPLAHITGSTTVDMSVQPIESKADQIDPRLDALDAFVRGYQYGPAQPYRPGAMLGSNGDMGWNNITLTVDGAEVVAAFPFSPFDGISGAWLFVDGHYLHDAAADAPDWTDYRFAPGGGAGTKTICIEAVDETTGATPKWTARLMTYSGTYGNALLAGLLPLVTYQWTGAAIDGGGTMQASTRLRAVRGERQHRDAGGDVIYLAPTTMGSGTGSLALSVATGSTLKGTERLHLLADDDDDTADATIAFERMLVTLDGLHGYVEKVAAQANAAAQAVDTEFAGLQLGGAGDLMLVGRLVTDGALTTRRVAISHAANPATKEIVTFLEDGGSGEDAWPTGGTKKPILLTGDFGFSGANGKRVYQKIPHRPVRGIVHDGGAGCILGPWFFGPMGTGLNHEPANDGVHWLDYVLLNPNMGGGLIEPRTDAWIPIDVRELDKAYDVAVYLSLDETPLAGQVEMMFDLIKVNATGTVTVVGELKAGAGNRWISLATPNGAVAGWRSLGAHGKDSATGNDWWTEDIREFDVNYTWFIRVRADVWTADPLNLLAGRGAVWFGLPYINVQRQKPFGR